MTGRTHDLAGLTLLHLVIVSIPLPTMTISTALASIGMVCIGSLTPDIDQPTADLWRRLPAGTIIGKIISPILGSHRMISHSLLGTALFAYASYWLFQKLGSIILLDMTVIWWAFLIGFISHLAIDFLNREGLPLFFPLAWKFGFPPLKVLRIKAGGTTEKTVIYPLLLLINCYIVYTHYQLYPKLLSVLIK
jgi:inner membrane protein